MATPGAAELERRVLILVATRKDGDVSLRLLTHAGLPATVCHSISQLGQEIAAGAAAVLATAEMVDGSQIDELLRALDTQEEWSDLPFVVLMKDGVQSGRAAGVLQRLTNVTILERPAGMRSVLSAVQAAVRGRFRQYQTRSHIQAIQAAEAKARDAGRAKDDFLAVLSHELRTPLTPVLLIAGEAAADSRLPPEARRDFETVARNVALEARLIDDLLDLTRITRGKLNLEKSPLDALAVLREALANLKAEFAQKRLELTTVFAAGTAVVDGDPARLQQVFWNVLKNAAKFTPPGGQVTVHTGYSENQANLVVEVTDSGIGMTPAELARAFEAFAQGEHAVNGCSRRFGGLGLGLAISRSLVKMHSGRISAMSEGPGRGTTLTIELPLAAPVATSVRHGGRVGEAAPGAVVSPSSLKILVVEDDELTRNVLKRLLTTRRHAVETAASLGEARSAARSGTYDLLISDIGLPDGSGYTLVEELTSAHDTVAIALTGYGMEDDVERARSAGFFRHLTKPLRVAALDAALKAVMELRRPRRAGGNVASPSERPSRPSSGSEHP